MTNQTDVQPPKNAFTVIRRIGRFMTKMLYLEMIIYLVLGLAALLLGGVNWLVEVLR